MYRQCETTSSAGRRHGVAAAGRREKGVRLAAFFMSGVVLSAALAQSPRDTEKSAALAGKPSVPATASHYQPSRFSGRAGTYYKVIWGVDSLELKWVESGEVIRFSYRVLDPDKARALNDKKSQPSLIDLSAGAQLVVPSMEKIGQLRQSADPEEGKSYWMAFSNKGRLVKRGDRVTVVIGPFRADGLVVD
jgi:hypothetical protein